MSSYTLYDQIAKIYQNVVSFYKNPKPIVDKLRKNDYEKRFMDDNNQEPLVTLLGSIADYFSGREPDVKVVENFELDKYLGEWFEVARYLSVFEGEEIVKAKAIYKMEDDILSVTNIGYHADGREEIIRGTASQKYPGTTIGKLNVSFFPPFNGNYWIIMLSDSYSVVSSPDKKLLWILSRAEKLPEETMKMIIDSLEKMNYDTSKLHFSV